MTTAHRHFFRLSLLFFAAGAACSLRAQNPDTSLYREMRWRMIGPHRGGRTVGASGVPRMPNVFYAGVNNGGVWKTDDYGRTWKPIFDDQPTGSIGTLAVAPSNPAVLYVGSGEGLQRPDLSTGDGIYKSTDAGRSWVHLGLRSGEQISSIIVDPQDPDRLFVAVLGHPYGANEERGVYRSTDGGAGFQKVLYRDENTGAVALSFDPSDARTVYASLWSARQAPWENGQWEGPGSGLYKSTDGGSTWRQLSDGLPSFGQGLGRIGMCVAPALPARIYALASARAEFGGLFRSDDAGEHWRRINSDVRLWGRGDDFAEVKVDPENPDIVYCANIVTWRSSDGGSTFTALKGAPGGDDYHTIWINPLNSRIMMIAGDQGATISVNGGETWSSWYNQPTAQFYHVITDHQFPYRVYGGQQESGSVGIASRGSDGAITFRDWHPVGVDEYGYVAPDPLNPRIIYGGRITRTDLTTGQVRNISPDLARSGKYRVLRTAPVLFSPVDPHTLYYAMNVLFKTTDGGDRWEVISPDLSRERPEVPSSVGIFNAPELAHQPRRGVIYTVAPSPRDSNLIWAGTDDGLIHVTHDGGSTWRDVTPRGVTSWSKVSLMDASHFRTSGAYAAVNRIRCDDLHPYIYRTHDGGATWELIVRGLPGEGPVNAVREDPSREGLLFCGTETAVYFSLNGGDTWQPLRLNMPATSIRDLVIHDDDLVVATHGRSFWILDDITPLRQMTPQVAESPVTLFSPAPAWRVRWNTNTDTPLPPEEPAGENPPDGAIIDYVLRSVPSSPPLLEIR
ncbi:MAG TPA: glycoside hydrolase, partial [Bacteroidota bacterium]|nr:glycoside hydrolase [Bacteroidota bacterium]